MYKLSIFTLEHQVVHLLQYYSFYVTTPIIFLTTKKKKKKIIGTEGVKKVYLSTGGSLFQLHKINITS